MFKRIGGFLILGLFAVVVGVAQSPTTYIILAKGQGSRQHQFCFCAWLQCDCTIRRDRGCGGPIQRS